jgi:hypothetical protein
MENVTLTLTVQEAVDVTNIIGQLPTQSNAYPLFVKIKGQIEAQAQAAQPATQAAEPAAPETAPAAN